MKISLAFLSTLAVANAFISPTPLVQNSLSRDVSVMMADQNEDSSPDFGRVPAMTAALWALTSAQAMAAGPDWGIFEGKTLSLLHPVMMASMLGLSVSAAVLGFDWRRQRTLGTIISDLKKTLPNLGGASSIAEAVSNAEAAENPALAAQLKAATSIETEIGELQAERKALADKGPRDKHFSRGSLLALLGTCFAIEVSELLFHQGHLVLRRHSKLTMFSSNFRDH